MTMTASSVIARYVADYPAFPVALTNGYTIECRIRRTPSGNKREWLAYHDTDGCTTIEFRATNELQAEAMIDDLLRVGV
jgi:hypothetical protein